MFFLPDDRRRAKRTETLCQLILEKVNTMPTEAELNTRLDELETALTQEIGEITAALQAQGVSQATIDRVTGLRDRIAGIINPPPPPTP